MFSANAVKIA